MKIPFEIGLAQTGIRREPVQPLSHLFQRNATQRAAGCQAPIVEARPARSPLRALLRGAGRPIGIMDEACIGDDPEGRREVGEGATAHPRRVAHSLQLVGEPFDVLGRALGSGRV